MSAIISVGGDNLIGFCGRKKKYATKNAYQAGLLASKKFVLQNCLTLNSEYQNLESKFFWLRYLTCKCNLQFFFDSPSFGEKQIKTKRNVITSFDQMCD